MHKLIELTIAHDGCDWVTYDMDYQLRGKDLADLEVDISNAIKLDPRFNDNETIEVTFQFDMDNFPDWFSQYQSHYFNYTFTVYKRKLI